MYIRRTVTVESHVWRCSSLIQRSWVDMWYIGTTIACDAWPVWLQTYSYLPHRRALPPLDRY